jgi:hypothetical protein
VEISGSFEAVSLVGHDAERYCDWPTAPWRALPDPEPAGLDHGPGADLLSRFQIGVWHPGPSQKGC